MNFLKEVLIFIAGIHFILFVVYFLIYLRNNSSGKEKINLGYSMFNLSYFLVNVVNRVYFPDILPLTTTTTYFLVCSSAYFGYLLFNLKKYKLIILVAFVVVSGLWGVGLFSLLVMRLFYLSAAIFAGLYAIILTIEIFKKREIKQILANAGFIFLYLSFIMGGVIQGIDGDLTLHILFIARLAPMFVLVSFSLYLSFQIYRQNESIRLTNKELEKTNTLLQEANIEIEEQKKATEAQLIKRVQQIDEINIAKYSFKDKVKEALLHTLQGLTDEAIALKMDRSDSMVKKYLAIARERINEDGHELKTKNDLIYHFRKMSG